MQSTSILAFITLTLLSVLPGPCISWGDVPHEIIAEIAMELVTPHTKQQIHELLGKNTIEYASTWADRASHSKSHLYDWSKPLHYVSVGSNSDYCGVDLNRDCRNGFCVIGAIANYTTRLSSCNLSKPERLEALKFAVHFVSDSMQPLHNAQRERGGTHINVKFAPLRKKTNLHSVWDSRIMNKHLSEHFGGSKATFVAHAVGSIRSGKYKEDMTQWTACFKNNMFGGLTNSAAQCAIAWAKEANHAACTVAYPLFDELNKLHQEAVRNMHLNSGNPPYINLGTNYYQRLYQYVEKLIVEAGVRLAGMLDLAFRRDCQIDVGKTTAGDFINAMGLAVDSQGVVDSSHGSDDMDEGENGEQI